MCLGFLSGIHISDLHGFHQVPKSVDQSMNEKIVANGKLHIISAYT